jgi:hypothetical protein
MEDLLRDNLPELGSIDDVTPEMFKKVLMTEGHKLKDSLPREWTFGGIKRKPDGKFDDVDLAEIIKDCIESPAHAFGALQARDKFQVCTMNE